MRRSILILMVRNESKILERCLKSVEGLVDAYCICDTGSTDTTCEIAEQWLKTHDGILHRSQWKNFGYNRTVSFEAAAHYVKYTRKWDPTQTFGLLMDADMVFVSDVPVSEMDLTEIGYTVVQSAGNLEYPNCRLVRMDFNWICRGVTHEYWDGLTVPLPKETCFILDQNDGGCKSDKFERDARLLEEGLRDEPGNVRYMFYLAQTYHSLGRWKDAIAMYKKRIQGGGWYEEVWYAHYMIGQSYLALDDPIRFEAWMLRAFKLNPKRAEPLYKMARHFREKGAQHKAYAYVQMGKSIPNPNESLFMEKDVYEGLFDYEASILMYYVGVPRQTGLRQSVEYLLTKPYHQDSVYRNMPFYIEPIGRGYRNHPIPRSAAGLDYHPTSTSVFEWKGRTFQNVRFVNYAINQHTGGYSMKEGGYSDNHKVRTQNVIWDGEACQLMDDASVDLPRRDAHIRGLEDVRVYRSESGLKFVATSSEYSEKIRIVHGDYDVVKGKYSNCKVLESPTNADCEKNWIPLHDDPRVIYRWYPMESYCITDSQMVLRDQHATPWLFQHIRGSAVPVRVDNELWALVHSVEYSTPRKYFHWIVKLDPETLKPKALSLPFVFRAHGIEYCIGVQATSVGLECTVSSWDDNPFITHVSYSDLEWIQL